MLKTKIQNEKILYEGGRILCDGCKMKIEEVIKMVNHYIYQVKKMKEIKNILVDQKALNNGIRFNLFNIYCNVEKLFELYNEIARIEGLQVYDAIWYNPVASIKFSPSKSTKNEKINN